MGKYTEELSRRLKLTDKRQFYRESFQTYMTGPEWRNVEMAEEFAAFLRENRSLFHFPYFKQIAGLWRVIFKSLRAASQHDRQRDILLSEYTLMDLFIGFFTTLELLPKAIISLFLAPFMPKENPTLIQQKIADYCERYSLDLQTVPFYDHDYQSYYKELKQAYNDSTKRTWGDWFSWKIVALELKARYWISKPLHYWFHQEANLVSATTDVVVKARLDGIMDSLEAKQQFLRLLQRTNHTDISCSENDVYVKGSFQKNGQSYTSVYARLHTPRYAAFIPAVNALTEQNIALRKIAGQNQVQVKCVSEGAAETPVMPHTPNTARTLYTYEDNIHPAKRFCLFDVPVRYLQQSVADFEHQEGVKVQFIHNF